MGRQLLHVEQDEPVRGKNLFRGQKREVGKMLVIDGVELVAFDQLQQVRELHGENALWLEQ